MAATLASLKEDLLPRLAGGLAVVMIAALLLGQFFPALGALNDVAAAAAVALALVRIGSVARIARVFVGLAILSVVLIALLSPAQMPAMARALMQGTAFSAFLTTLGLIRAPVRASKVILKAAGRLFASPARRMRAAITYGAEFLAVLFNIGAIGMISDIATDHAARAKAEGKPGIDPKGVTLTALRGTLMMTVWNPIGVGFAIVTAAIPALDPVAFLLLSFVVAMLISAGGLGFGRSTAPAADPEARPDAAEARAGSRALLAILAAIAGLIAVTVLIHRAAGVGFLIAACLVLPLLAILWPLVEPAARRKSDESAFDALAGATASTASEATIFLAAAVIGAAASVFLSGLGLDRLIESGALPARVLILGCLVLVPLAGALMIPHSIVMVLIAQLFGTGPVGAAHPLALALALCLAWAFAISASPISAMSIITARHLGISTTRLTFGVNRAFTLYGLTASALLVTLVYLCE